MGKGVSLSFMAWQSKLSPELLDMKEQYFSVSGLVNSIRRNKDKIRSLTANGLLGPTSQIDTAVETSNCSSEILAFTYN